MLMNGTTTGRRVLACDDEHQILRALKLTLRGAGYEVLPAATMEEALDAAALSPVDAAIVDLLLPDGDGVELCSRLREWSEMPIIVLSAVDEETQKVRALRAGADDYVTKPIGQEELVARLEAVLRRVSPEPDQSIISVAGLEIDLAAHVVRRDGDPVHLTRIEFELLRVLALNRGRLLTHPMLLSGVWGPGYADDVQVLRTHVARLRAKIDPAGAKRRHYIRTETGIGYRFDPK
jgi:two-component system KDP operon response regulator KdpE